MMQRRAFFSFHYESDMWRANIIRNSWATRDREAEGFWDAGLWETAKRHGNQSIKEMIDEGLKDTTVTLVLVGAQTWQREWVNYTIKESCKRKNGLLAIYVDRLQDRYGRINSRGENPFAHIYWNQADKKLYLSDRYPAYEWISDQGYDHIVEWVEKAAKKAGK